MVQPPPSGAASPPGALMMPPSKYLRCGAGHDVNDYEIGKRRGLETINIMNKVCSACGGRGVSTLVPADSATSYAPD